MEQTGGPPAARWKEHAPLCTGLLTDSLGLWRSAGITEFPASAPASGSDTMSFEARVFFPLEGVPAGGAVSADAQQQATSASASASVLVSATSAPTHPPSRPFSLFEREDYQLLFPQEHPPSLRSDEHAERRTDLYLLDPSLPHMERYGLKLRGADSSPSSSPAASASSPREYQLELKLRKELSAFRMAENWKKVVKNTRIHAALPRVAREALPALRQAHARAVMLSKHRVAEGVGALMTELEKRAAGAGDDAHAFYVVAVRKQRHELPHNCEQTDVEVELLWAGQADPLPPTQRRVLRYRSICFEGSETDTTAKHVQRLFQHLRQRHGDMAVTTGAATDTTSASGAFVGGYPEFLLRVLQLQPATTSASSHGSSAAVAMNRASGQCSAL